MTVAKWFENKYLDYQKENGRISVRNFAEILGISPAYLSHLMNGKNKGVSAKTAQQVCEKLSDWSLYELLDFDKPASTVYLPENFRKRLEGAQAEVEKILEERGLYGDSPEAEGIVIEIFERFGFKYTDTEK